MTGKEKCKLLKLIRQQIAEANNIEYKSVECSYDGPCSGTCAKCDIEIRYLETQLKAKAVSNEAVSINGLATETFSQAVSCSHIWKGTHSNTYDWGEMGDLLPPFRPATKEVSIDDPIENLGISKAREKALLHANITTIRQLTTLSERKLHKIHGIGGMSIAEIKQKLQGIGLSLAEEEPSSLEDITPGIFPLQRKK